MAETKQKIFSKDDLLKHINEIVEIANYEASKKIKDPRKKRSVEHSAKMWNSILYYLTENQNTNDSNTETHNE